MDDVKTDPARKGLALSRDFYRNVLGPALNARFPALAARTAVGLVGNGSECFGYDDALSRDHDWGASVYLWLCDGDTGSADALDRLQQALLQAHPAYPPRVQSRYGAAVGAVGTHDFYLRLTGFPEGPQTLQEWRLVPEELLALATNGEVFSDPVGCFTAIRTHLLQDLPEDLRLRRILSSCMSLAQTGQYNLPRYLSRGLAAEEQLLAARFAQETVHLTFLLNRRYMPYYKWSMRALSDLPLLGGEVRARLGAFLLLSPGGARLPAAEALCRLFAETLRREGLSTDKSDFLADHGPQIARRIQDPTLRALPLQATL